MTHAQETYTRNLHGAEQRPSIRCKFFFAGFTYKFLERVSLTLRWTMTVDLLSNQCLRGQVVVFLYCSSFMFFLMA